MSYMVIFRTPEGKPGYQPADGVNDAVETVERLRNQDGVDNVRIYRMEEVPFSYKVHYTVELGDASAPEDPVVQLSGGGESLTWDDDSTGAESSPPAEESTEDTGQPFDQMAAIDHTEPPRWGDEPSGEDQGGSPEGDVEGEGESGGYGEYSAATGYRRGLFGR